MVKHAGLLAMTLGEVPPIRAVSFNREGGPAGKDSGFLVVFSDAPEPDDVEVWQVDWLCLHCLIDEHPEVGRAMDLAREHGEVWRDDAGEWWPLEEVGE